MRDRTSPGIALEGIKLDELSGRRPMSLGIRHRWLPDGSLRPVVGHRLRGAGTAESPAERLPGAYWPAVAQRLFRSSSLRVASLTGYSHQ